jgi:hypothetical protein
MYPEATPIIEAYRAACRIEARWGLNPAWLLPTWSYLLIRQHRLFTRSSKHAGEVPGGDDETFSIACSPHPLMPHEIKGLDMLIALGEQIYEQRPGD